MCSGRFSQGTSREREQACVWVCGHTFLSLSRPESLAIGLRLCSLGSAPGGPAAVAASSCLPMGPLRLPPASGVAFRPPSGELRWLQVAEETCESLLRSTPLSDRLIWSRAERSQQKRLRGTVGEIGIRNEAQSKPALVSVRDLSGAGFPCPSSLP